MTRNRPANGPLPRSSLTVEMRPIAEIKPYERNPKHNDRAVAAVAESIRRLGFRQPIVVDVCGYIR